MGRGTHRECYRASHQPVPRATAGSSGATFRKASGHRWEERRGGSREPSVVKCPHGALILDTSGLPVGAPSVSLGVSDLRRHREAQGRWQEGCGMDVTCGTLGLCPRGAGQRPCRSGHLGRSKWPTAPETGEEGGA